MLLSAAIDLLLVYLLLLFRQGIGSLYVSLAGLTYRRPLSHTAQHTGRHLTQTAQAGISHSTQEAAAAGESSS